jgi:hypothetical protein
VLTAGRIGSGRGLPSLNLGLLTLLAAPNGVSFTSTFFSYLLSCSIFIPLCQMLTATFDR